MLGRFFRRGEGSAWVLLSTGENLYWYTFSGGDSIPGRFFRGEVLCGGKLYATTPPLSQSINYQFRILSENNSIQTEKCSRFIHEYTCILAYVTILNNIY